jgi:hypothetical protein
MGMLKEKLEALSFAALMEGEIIIDGKTYKVWGSSENESTLMESLDECYSEMKIGDVSFYAGQVVKNCDPVMWDIMLGEQAYSLIDANILVYGYTLMDAITDANDFVETVEDAYTVGGVNA